MQTEINLLQTQQKVQKKRSAFFKLCALLLFAVVLFTIAEITYTFYLRTQLSDLSEDQSATLSQITTLDAKRVKFQTLKERLAAISKILPESVTFNTRINAIFQNIPSGINADGLDANSKSITLRISSSSLALLDEFLTNGASRIARDKSIGVSQVEVNSVGLGLSEAAYSATVIFYFN